MCAVVVNMKWNTGAAPCGARVVLVAPRRGHQRRAAALIVRMQNVSNRSCVSSLPAMPRRHQYRSRTSSCRSSVPFHIGGHYTFAVPRANISALGRSSHKMFCRTAQTLSLLASTHLLESVKLYRSTNYFCGGRHLCVLLFLVCRL